MASRGQIFAAALLVVFLAGPASAVPPLSKGERQVLRDQAIVQGRVRELQEQLDRAWKDARAGATSLHLSSGFVGPSMIFGGGAGKGKGAGEGSSRGKETPQRPRKTPIIFSDDLESRPAEDWPMFQKSLRKGYYADISAASPVLVLTPVLESAHVDRLASKFDATSPKLEHLIGQRALHSARLVRLARDLVHLRLNLSRDSEARLQQGQPGAGAVGDRRAALVVVLVPLELAGIMCRVVEDEFREWPTRALCRTYHGEATDRRELLSREATQNGRQPEQGGTPGRAMPCSYAMWGFSGRARLDGAALAGAHCPGNVGLAVDLDKGDKTMPRALSKPSWVQGSFPGEEELRVSRGDRAGGATIVTACSGDHSSFTLRLMNSVLVHGPGSSVPVSLVVYIMADVSREIKNKMSCIRRQLVAAGVPTALREFDFGKHPSWMHIKKYKAGWWAWKAVMVWENMVLTRGPVLWLDGGDLVTSPSALPETLKALGKQKFVGITKDVWGSNYRWTHTNSSLFLGTSTDPSLTQCCGCLFGVTPQIYATVVRPFYECSRTLQCISPQGAGMSNHRQDQSVLSTLALSAGLTCSGVHPEVKVKCDNYWSCTRQHAMTDGAAGTCGFQ